MNRNLTLNNGYLGLTFFADVNMVLRKAGKMSTTNITIGHEDDGTWTYDYTIAFKSGNLRFKLGEPFNETTADGRKVTVCVLKNRVSIFIRLESIHIRFRLN